MKHTVFPTCPRIVFLLKLEFWKFKLHAAFFGQGKEPAMDNNNKGGIIQL
ncbi:MAG: hypothetical protein ACLFN9_00810 [Desulfococcaceae bacterium]